MTCKSQSSSKLLTIWLFTLESWCIFKTKVLYSFNNLLTRNNIEIHHVLMFLKMRWPLVSMMLTNSIRFLILFGIWKKCAYKLFNTSSIFSTMPNWKRIWITRFMQWLISCTLIINDALQYFKFTVTPIQFWMLSIWMQSLGESNY